MPSDDLTPELQLRRLSEANVEGLNTAERLRQTTDRGDQLLGRIRELLHITSSAILETRKVQAQLKGEYDDEDGTNEVY